MADKKQLIDFLALQNVKPVNKDYFHLWIKLVDLYEKNWRDSDFISGLSKLLNSFVLEGKNRSMTVKYMFFNRAAELGNVDHNELIASLNKINLEILLDCLEQVKDPFH